MAFQTKKTEEQKTIIHKVQKKNLGKGKIQQLLAIVTKLVKSTSECGEEVSQPDTQVNESSPLRTTPQRRSQEAFWKACFLTKTTEEKKKTVKTFKF